MLRRNRILALLTKLGLALAIGGCTPKPIVFQGIFPAAGLPPGTKIKTVRVDDFSSNARGAGRQMRDLIEAGITREDTVHVVPGRAEATISGSVTVDKFRDDSSHDSWDCSYEKDGKKVYKTCHSYSFWKRGGVGATYRLHGTRKGYDLAGDSFSFQYDEKFTSGESSSAARAQAPTDSQIVGSLMSRIAEEIVHDVTPHRRPVSREVPSLSDANLKLGLDYMRAGRTGQAYDLFSRVAQSASDSEVRAAAHYLAGVALESQAQYEKAFDSYATANQLDPTNRIYIEVLSAAQRRREEVKAAMSQRQ